MLLRRFVEAEPFDRLPADEVLVDDLVHVIRRDSPVPDAFGVDDDRAALLAAATVFVFPSRYEGFGFPPLESMSAGVPVVATAAGALPEVLGDAALLVPPGDGDALAAAMAGLLDDDSERARLVAAGHDRQYSPRQAALGFP